jgi:type II secretion system protein I
MMRRKSSKGFTLIEALYSVSLFVIVVMAVFAAYQALYRAMAVSEDKLFALELAQNRFEELENMSYAQISTSTSAIAVQRNGRSYTLSLTVSPIDDPFDGLAPTDTDPADYKHAYITVSCSNCRSFAPVTLSGRYAP